MKRLRRGLLELWAVLMLAGVVGFLGPFGTYLMGDLLSRTGRWWALLMGAYVLMRPTMTLCRWGARAMGLPPGFLVLWGMVISSIPMTLIWKSMAAEETRLLGGYSGLLPLALLCSLAIIVVVWWAERAEAHLLHFYRDSLPAASTDGTAAAMPETAGDGAAPTARPLIDPVPVRPRLYARLSPRFEGDVLALESEDHYVRVHGQRQSELLLMRLRDAIVEMDHRAGEQTHRSWWVARDAVAETVAAGRKHEIRLVNGIRVPVARDSVDRLQRSGFLPG